MTPALPPERRGEPRPISPFSVYDSKMRRIIVSSRPNLSSAQRHRIRIHRGGDQPSHQRRKRGIAYAGGSSDSITLNEDGLSASSSSSSSSSSSFYSSSSADQNYLALGAVAVASSSVAASIFKWKPPSINEGRDGDNTRLYRHGHTILSARRRYRSTAASCEPNSSKTSKKDIDGTSTTSNDSFFDVAQQLASDYVPRTSEDKMTTTMNDEDDDKKMYNHLRVERKSADAIAIKNTDKDSIKQAPLASLLDAMGILGGNVGVKVNEQRNKVAEDERSNLKGMMQRVWFNAGKSNDKFMSPFPNNMPSEVNDAKSEADKAANESSSIFKDFLSFADSPSLFTRMSSAAPPDIESLIQQAQQIAANQMASPSSDGGSSMLSPPSSSGFLSQVLYFQQNAKAIQRAFESSFGISNYFPEVTEIKDLIPANPLSAFYYYLEHQDATKTPSWKRRMHRYQRNVEVTKVEELNEALLLSELSYADGVEEVRAGLETLRRRGREKDNSNKPQWELLFCDTESRPNEPSHFLAIQKNASPFDDVLHVLMVVRGTKSMSDLITDAMMDASDYEYAIPGGGEDGKDAILRGKVHSGMQLSGKYLVDRHLTLLSTLSQLSKRQKIEITLIGHSLGAGAATIAAMEWNSKPFGREKSDLKNMSGNANDIQVSAHVIGFGCPALLSKSLSLATKDYVTTVIADADFIPRMSGATLFNLLLDVKNFDYRMQAERDVELALRELKGLLSFKIAEDDIQSVMGYVRRGLEKVTSTAPSAVESMTKNKDVDDANNTETEKRKENETENVKIKEPVLFPPGDCIHFYRDGSGISGSYVPCDFFNEVRSHSCCDV
jgi:hypothetical protein